MKLNLSPFKLCGLFKFGENIDKYISILQFFKYSPWMNLEYVSINLKMVVFYYCEEKIKLILYFAIKNYFTKILI